MKILSTLLSCLLSITAAHANIIYVDGNAAAGGDGTSWETAFKYLQDALDVTVSGRGDQVWIAQGTYYPDDGANVTEGDRLASFVIKDQVALYGGFIGVETDLAQRDWESHPTILSGEILEDKTFWSIHVTTIDNNTVTFDGIAVTKGNANGGEYDVHLAAAVYGQGHVTAINCTFSENSANYYGGVAYRSTWTATNCTFSSNSADWGGVANGGAWTATNCTFSSNSAGYGGVADGSTWTATNCTFSSNSANTYGGVAVSAPIGNMWAVTWIVNNCTFSGNSATQGGGVAHSGTWIATNSSFSGNSADWGGVAFGGAWTATNCTFSSNSADKGGGYSNSRSGGVAKGGSWTTTNCTFLGNSADRGGVAYEATWKIFQNIFYNNSADAQFRSSTIFVSKETTTNPLSPSIVYAKNLIQGESAAFVDCTVPLPIPEANFINSNPLFVNSSDPDGPDDIWGTEDDGLRLQANSPAIGLGDADFLPVDIYDFDEDGDTEEPLPVDFAGYNRIQSAALDLGAYEYGNIIGPSFTTTIGAATGGTVSTSGALVNTQPTEITLTAAADNGYVFGYWAGNVPEELEQENPLTLTVEENGIITAVFLQDTADTDGDGLSQYEEVIVHGTDPADPDSDNDGFNDGFEVETGYSPLNASSTPDAVSGIVTAVKYWFNAASGVSYRIEYSTDLENWFTLEDNIQGAGGEIVRYYDVVASEKRFYRAKRNN